MIVLAVSVAGGIKGLFGVGFPTAGISLCSLFIEPVTAVILMSVPILLLNLVQVAFGNNPLTTLRKYWRILVVAAPVGGVVGYLSVNVPQGVLVAVLGLMVLSFSVLNLFAWVPKISDRFDKPAQIVTGGVSGVVSGLTLLWAPPLMAYLLSRDTGRKEWIGIIGLILGLGTVPVVLGFLANGTLGGELLVLSALISIPALLFQLIGEFFGRRIQPDRFRRYLLWMFLVFGLSLLARAFLA